MERVRAVVYVLGSEQYGSLEDQLVSHLGSTFTLQFRSHYKEEARKKPNKADLNKSLLPGEGWVRRWTEEQPSVIVDVLDQVDPSAISLAQSALKASGVSYYVLLSTGTSSLDSVYPWAALGSLKEAMLDSSISFYKDKAKRYRKWVALKQDRFQAGFGSLVRYNVKAGWMEELGMDLPGAVRAYHVAYSALVEAAKQAQDRTSFIASSRSVSDYLARKIVCGLARSGSALEADAYLRNHHTWSGASETDQLANVLAVAESFSHPTDPASPLIPGHYYLQAINLARSMGARSIGNLDLAHLRSILTLAFDSYKASGRGAKRHLIYISLLSADLFEHGQSMEMLSQAVRDEKWDRMAALMIRGSGDLSVQSAWFGLAHTDLLDEEALISLLETGSGTVQFGGVQDTCHLPCAMRFLHTPNDTLHVQVTLCNMSPIAISLDSIILGFKEGEDITIHAAEEIIPGATYSVSQSIDGPDRVLRLDHVRLQCGSLSFSYSASSLCTVEILYLLSVAELERWNGSFLRSLGGYWERAKINIPRPREVSSVPQVTCSAISTLATRVPVKFIFEGPAESLHILGCDHGTFDPTPFPIDDGPIEITWNIPGTKSVHFEARNNAGETRLFLQQFQLADPFKFEFNLIRSSPEVSLLTVDLTIQIEGIRLAKWDLLDSSSGTILTAIKTIPSKEAYLRGDILRAGFILPETHGDLVFRVGWTTDTIAQCTTSAPCPSHILAAPAGLMLGTEASVLKARVGERISLRWTLISHLDAPSIPLTMTISDRPTDSEFEDSWVYEGPCVVDVTVEPGQRYTVEAWVTGLWPGRIALPIVTVTPTNTAHVMHPITSIKHPRILITN